jgi:hypothetical protein
LPARPAARGQHLVGDLLVQRLGNDAPLDQLGLCLERPRADDRIGPHLADALEHHEIVAAGAVEVDRVGGGGGPRLRRGDGNREH